MITVRARAIGAAAASAALAAGCASTQGTGATPAPPKPFEVLSSRAPAASDALRPSELEPLEPGVVRWQRTDGTAPFDVTTAGAHPRFTRTDPVATRTITRSADGAVSLERQRDASDGATLVFSAPLLLAPPVLAPGEEPNSTSVVVTEREQVRDNEGGRAQRSLRIASVDRVRTPLGEFEAVRVDATLSMKVPFASLRRETSTWVRPGFGPIAVRSDERVLVMGVVPRNRSETRVRLPASGAPR